MTQIERLAVASLFLAALLAALTLTTSHLAAQESGVMVSQFPETVNTQSGAIFVDGAGRLFLVGRSVSRASLVVYVDGELVLSAPEAYGSPFGQIRPDGTLWVSAMDRDQRTIRAWQVPGWTPVSFASRAALLPLVTQ